MGWNWPNLFCTSLTQLQEQLKALLKEETFNPFLTYTYFDIYTFIM